MCGGVFFMLAVVGGGVGVVVDFGESAGVDFVAFGVLYGFRGCWGGVCCGGGEKGVDGALARCVSLLVAG